MTVHARSLVLAFALLLGSARGQAEPAPSGLPVVITVGSSSLDAAALEGALRRELGVPLSFDPLARERLEIVITGRRANVTYYRTGGEPVTRSVDLPRDDERSLETVAFLAGNLARDEAAELLRELKPPPSDAEEPPAPPPPAPPAVAPPPTETAKALPVRKPGQLIEPNPFAFNVSVWYPATLLSHTEQRRLSVELGLAYSRVGALRGAAFTLGYLRFEEPSEGYAHAVFWNRAGPFTGIQTANFVNEGHGPLKGISYADLVNFRDGDILGAQGAGLYAQANAVVGAQGAGLFAWSESIRGLQLGGLGSYVEHGVTGVQLSGTTAIAKEDVEGVQLAGLLAYRRDLRGFGIDGLVGISRDVAGLELGGLTSIGRDVKGVQAAGLFNLARDVAGLQIGTVNVARRVSGLQLGVVNVSDEMEGGAIGLVNVSKNGKVQPSVWYSGPDTWLNGGVKFVTGHTYALLGAGYDSGGGHFRYEGSAGLHLPVQRGYLETGLGFAHLHDTKNRYRSTRQEARYEARVGYEVLRHVTPFAGGGLTARIEGEGADFRGEYFVGVSVL